MRNCSRRRQQGAGSGFAGDAAVELVGVSKRFGAASFVGVGAGDDPDDVIEDDDEPADEPALTSGAVALDDVTLAIARGTVFGIAGAHGAGKTTLVRLIAGTLVPTSGEVRVCGCVSPPPETLGRLLDPAGGGERNLALLARFLGLQESIATLDVAAVFALAGLTGCEHVPFASIARRELPALLAAAVVALRPDIYLFDPAPKIADQDVRAAIDELLAERVRWGAVVVLTGENADRLPADAVALLKRGRLIEVDARTAAPVAVPSVPPASETAREVAAMLIDPPDAVAPPPPAEPAVLEATAQSPNGAPPPDPPGPALRLRRVDVDLDVHPATVRLLVEVPVARVDATFGFIFRKGARNLVKLRSAGYALRAGCFEVVAYLGALSGPLGGCTLLVGVMLDRHDEKQSVGWPEAIPIDVGEGLDGPPHTSWRVEPVDPSDVVERRPVAAGEPAKAEHEDEQREDAR